MEQISVYTREQAIKDKQLFDVTVTAKEAGIKHPTAVTHGVWSKYVVVPPQCQGRGQCISGRLWDILWMFAVQARCQGDKSDRLTFSVLVRNQPDKMQHVKLLSICGPDDHGNPCITIMLPDED